MISRPRQLFRKVTVVGIGLIGGSIALALKQQRLAKHVVGVSRRQVTLQYAQQHKIVDRATSDLKKGIENADLVILSLPVKSIIQVLSIIPRFCKRGCIVTDVGSIKGSIVDAAHKSLPGHVSFVGAHPLAGSEKSGIANARFDLFAHSLCVITAHERTSKSSLERIRSLWKALGARVETMSPADHDKAVAFTSHAPHLLAYGLTDLVPKASWPYCATGFKDTTRIAASDPKLWVDISLENARNIVEVIDGFVGILSEYRKLILAREEKGLTEAFARARQKRESLE